MQQLMGKGLNVFLTPFHVKSKNVIYSLLLLLTLIFIVPTEVYFRYQQMFFLKDLLVNILAFEVILLRK